MLRGRDFIAENDWNRNELETAIDLAFDLKHTCKLGKPTPYLRYKTLFLLFFFSSTRTRTSFEAAMDQLGGSVHDLTPDKLQIAHGDTPKEIGVILGRYGHGIAIRHCDWGVGNTYIREVAKYATCPVYNMQCDIFHPFQAMADLMTIMEKKKTLKRRKIVMSWVYAKSYTKPISVPQSFILLLTKFGADVTLSHPKEFSLSPLILRQAKENAQEHGGSLTLVHSMEEACEGADVVYAKSWGPMVTTVDPKQSMRLTAKYRSWITDRRHMELAKPDAIYMHCLPADRGVEVTDEVIDGPQSVVYDQAENRLHVQKAILALTMRDR